MKLRELFKKRVSKPQKNGAFASFFLNASEQEQNALLRRVAEESNQDQREIYRRAQLQLKAQE